MKNSPINKAGAVLVLMLAASSAWATVYQERDEANRSFTLPARARVEVVAINGSVDIKAVDGDTATVQIERTASSRAEMECNKVFMNQAGGNLVIRSDTSGCENMVIQVRHRLVLSLPRNVNLSVHGVSGPISIGEIEGAMRISGNSGSLNLTQPGRGSIISGNSGTTTIKIRQLIPGGFELAGNSGALRLQIADELNVDVRVSGQSGTVSSEVPNVQFIRIGAADYLARIGSGGPAIHVDGHSGSVLLGRY